MTKDPDGRLGHVDSDVDAGDEVKDPGAHRADIEFGSDPDVPGRARTPYGKQLQAYAASHRRDSRRRVSAAEELLEVENDAGVSALLGLMVDPNLPNYEDDDAYGAVEHRFAHMAARILLQRGGNAARAALWLVFEDSGGTKLRRLLSNGYVDRAMYSPPRDRDAARQDVLGSLRHVVASPQLENRLRRGAASSLIFIAGQEGYQDVKTLMTDLGLGWVTADLHSQEGKAYAFRIAPYVAQDQALSVVMRTDAVKALSAVHPDTGARALASVLRDLQLGDPRRRDLLIRLDQLEHEHEEASFAEPSSMFLGICPGAGQIGNIRYEQGGDDWYVECRACGVTWAGGSHVVDLHRDYRRG